MEAITHDCTGARISAQRNAAAQMHDTATASAEVTWGQHATCTRSHWHNPTTYHPAYKAKFGMILLLYFVECTIFVLLHLYIRTQFHEPAVLSQSLSQPDPIWQS